MNIAVAQSGGPTAAINSSLAGVFERAGDYGEIGQVFGSINGIEGMINDELVPLVNILTTDHDIDLLKRTPSTVLGSCRYKLRTYDPNDSVTETEYMNIVNTLEKHDIGAFFYIGGNDSMDTVMKLDKYLRAVGKNIKVIGIPKTIDNDLPGTDHTPGFGSAAKYVATTLQEIIRDSRVYSIQSITIVEIMGRNAGWLTASTCVLRANGEPAPHLIYVPEAYKNGFSIEKFLADVESMMKRYRAVIVAVSEGIVPDDRNYVKTGADAFGHTDNSGVAKYLEKCCADRFGCKVRSIELNVMQRCSSHMASATDLAEAEMVGKAAVDAAMSGDSGRMMGFRRISNEPYRVEVISISAEEAANRERFLPDNWITADHSDITMDALGYFLPLIQGEVIPEYRNGIPVHFRLNQ
ncbi:MAG: 6-phosphofructokinase [Oscillospiraceae bacterium]|nr:6-phosphofructokinase [Oscillospiraceae bacterium]MBQ8978360.1 6-phosphofructokinase [Oscillospiraceae bacterium]